MVELEFELRESDSTPWMEDNAEIPKGRPEEGLHLTYNRHSVTSVEWMRVPGFEVEGDELTLYINPWCLLAQASEASCPPHPVIPQPP